MSILDRLLNAVSENRSSGQTEIEKKPPLSATIAPYFLPAQLTFLSRRFPQARVTVVEEITPVLLERLRASVVDVAILALPIRGHEFETFPLLKEDLFAALAQFVIRHGDVDHPVAVGHSEPDHDGGAQHIQDQFLRRAALHS